mmetsp:Transcript_86941/g.153726  ORF Transcript_86941/g.153726 Transcript_86941/m.153726 type:complete len:171 (+) Transcript_86941:154-666(+)
MCACNHLQVLYGRSSLATQLGATMCRWQVSPARTSVGTGWCRCRCWRFLWFWKQVFIEYFNLETFVIDCIFTHVCNVATKCPLDIIRSSLYDPQAGNIAVLIKKKLRIPGCPVVSRRDNLHVGGQSLPLVVASKRISPSSYCLRSCCAVSHLVPHLQEALRSGAKQHGRR